MGDDISTGIILSADKLCYVKKGNHILQDVSLELHASEIATLIGPNGAGKTSLVKLLLGLEQPTAGSIYRQPGCRIGYVPQRVVVANELPLRVRDFLALSGKSSAAAMHDILLEMDVAELADNAIQNISGGEFQRVMLARALLNKPQLLVLDEPAQGLDVIGQQALYANIAAIRDRHHCAVLMVSHDLHLVMAATDKVICLNTHVCCTGHPDDVSTDPEYLKLFGSALDGLALYSHHHDHEHDVHGNIVRPDGQAIEHDGCQHD
jgi:zinc transport system ATP-binding protein